MKRLVILIAVMLATAVVNINAADSNMKVSAQWKIDLTNTQTPGTGGVGVTYTYAYDTKGFVVCKITTNTVVDPLGIVDDVVTTTEVELTLYNSKNEVVGKGTLPSIVGTSEYYIWGVMNGKVAIIAETQAKSASDDPTITTVNAYQINKEGKELKLLNITPLTATIINKNPIPDATYTSQSVVFICGVMIFTTITFTWDPVKLNYTPKITETKVYSKPDFKSCKIAGPGDLLYMHPPVVTKIWPLDNTVYSSVAPYTTSVDVAIVK